MPVIPSTKHKSLRRSTFKASLYYASLIFTIYSFISTLAIFHLQQNFKDQQTALAQSSALGVKRNIEDFVALKRKQLNLFINNESELLFDLIEFPSDPDSLDSIDKKIHSRINDVFSYMLATPDGKPLFEEKLTTVGPTCLVGIKRFTEERKFLPSSVVTHGNSLTDYHFDIMENLEHDKQIKGVFFLSFQLNNIINLLKNAELPHQNLLITLKNETSMIEISAQGIRTSKLGSSINKNLKPFILYQNNIKQTGWQVVALHEKNYLQDNFFSLMVIAILLGLLLVIISTYFLLHLKAIEYSKNKAELSLLKHFNNQEKTIIKRTKELNQEKNKAEVTLKSIVDGIITTDKDGLLKSINPIAEKLIGCLAAEVINLHINKIFNVIDYKNRNQLDNPVIKALSTKQTSYIQQDAVLKTHYGHDLFIESSCSPVLDESSKGLFGTVLVFRDITQRTLDLHDIKHQANHDHLTGLMNRKSFEEHCHKILERLKHKNSSYVLLYMDLDHFKKVNDQAGHNAGDRLLIELSNKIKGILRQRDILSRRGGDEFSVLLEHCNQETGNKIAKKIIDEVNNYQLNWKNNNYSVGISIGLLTFDNNNTSIEKLLNKADEACYKAKEAGRNIVITSE